MTITRALVPAVADERRMLDGWLEFHRATLEMKCDGLSADQLRQRAVPPSSLSLLGLIRHMTDVERHWFRNTLHGEDAPDLYSTEDDRDGDFDHIEDADPVETFAAWHAELDHSRQLLAAVPSLDEIGARPRRGQPVSVRWIVMHMIEEYARHNGHADFLRERIDGSVGA